MKQKLTILFIISSFYLISCKKENIKKEYFIISQQDSINKSFNYEKDTNKIPPPLPPPADFKWYSNVIFIMDSKNKVYIYQTESKINHKLNESDFEYDFGYPNYIELKPEHLVTFESEDFITFIKANNDILELYSNAENRTNRFFYIASECDTVKNTAAYELEKLFKNGRRVNYMIRKTTEEENWVLKYKRSRKKYAPENIKWSAKFLNGKLRPFTKEYKKTESNAFGIRKAKETFEKGGMDIFFTM
jgi:hypothetical protein